VRSKSELDLKSKMDVSLKFLVPSHPRYLSVVRAAVGELGAIYGLRDEECRGIILAVDEALTNIIRHAYRGDFSRTIEVNCLAGGGRLEFKLLDQGEPPDPVRLRPHELDAVALGGRGTHIIRSVMDEVCYERIPAGNQLKLGKHLPANRTDGEGEKHSYEHRDS
jgi:anti-sigma regulatory factor (Ser/Thr protein kinase)